MKRTFFVFNYNLKKVNNFKKVENIVTKTKAKSNSFQVVV